MKFYHVSFLCRREETEKYHLRVTIQHADEFGKCRFVFVSDKLVQFIICVFRDRFDVVSYSQIRIGIRLCAVNISWN